MATYAMARLAFVVSSLLCSGCLSNQAGFSLAADRVRERTGYNVHWQAVDPVDTGAAETAMLSRPLEASQAMRLALLKSPRAQVELERIGISRAALLKSVALPNPELDAGFLTKPRQTRIELAGAFDLTQVLLAAWRQTVAAADLDAASVEAAGALVDVGFDARSAWVEAVAAAETFELQRSLVDAAAGSAALAEGLAAAGNTSELFALQRQALLEEQRLELDQEAVARTAARERLCSAVGLWGVAAEKLTLPKSLPAAIDLDPAIAYESEAVAKSLDLEALRLRFRADAARIDAARAEGALPDVSAGVQAEREDEVWGYGPRVNVRLPVFDHGEGPTARAEAGARRTRAQYDVVAAHVRERARTLVARVRAAKSRIDQIDGQLLPLRARIAEQSLLQYNAMNASAFQLLSAKRDQIVAGRARVTALKDYWVARTELDRLIAGRLGSGGGSEGGGGTSGPAIEDAH